MNRAQLKCLGVFSVFAVIGFGPVSPSCLIGMYVVAARPRWFLELARELYADKGTGLSPAQPANSWPARTKCFLCLVGLFLLDIAPVPVTSTVAFVILLARPAWFHRMVETMYADKEGGMG